METKSLCILGSTGSIGTQALEVAAHLGLSVRALSAQRNTALLEEQIRRFRVPLCSVADEEAAKGLKIALADTSCRVLSGKDGAAALCEESDADTVLNSIIGFAGLVPTLRAIAAKKNLAIANKETLVAAGSIVMRAVRENGVRLLPVDSEHCAIHQCIGDRRKDEIDRLILTASGGPFFGKTKEEVENVPPSAALRHPNWSMGRKITIDSASMVNKGLELMEAMWLFDMPADKIDVLIHRESIVHSMVQFKDSSVMAQLAVPDMRLCIQYALTGGAKKDGLTPRLSLADVGKLTFYKPDDEVFPSVLLARRAAERGGVSPCVFNSANEALVALYLDGKIRFGEIFTYLEKALDTLPGGSREPALSDILDADLAAREFIARTVKTRSVK